MALLIKHISGLIDFEMDDLCEGFDVLVFKLSKNTDIVNFIFPNSQHLQSVGSIFVQELLGNPFAYLLSNENKEFDASSRIANAELFTKIIDDFCFFLWMVKDNSVHLGNNYTLHGVSINSINRNLSYSNCRGEYASVKFSLVELKNAEVMFEKLKTLKQTKLHAESKNNVKDVKGSFVPREAFQDYNQSTRISRAFQFLAYVRSEVFLPAKIAFYGPLFESLFTTDDQEIIHKVSERMAFYLGNTSIERREIFSKIKDCYTLRSRFLHGQKLDKSKDKKFDTIEKLKVLSEYLDNLTRRLLTKILMEDSDKFLDENKLEELFKNLLFGDAEPPTTTG